MPSKIGSLAPVQKYEIYAKAKQTKNKSANVCIGYVLSGQTMLRTAGFCDKNSRIFKQFSSIISYGGFSSTILPNRNTNRIGLHGKMMNA